MSPIHQSSISWGIWRSVWLIYGRSGLWIFIALCGGSLWSCDQDGKKQCAWVLEPEPNLIGTTDPAMIPVCARNRESFKEDCRMQASLEYAEKVYGRKFRYVDLRVKSTGIPRTIASIRFCDGLGN